MNTSTTSPVSIIGDVHRDALLTFTLDGGLYEAPILTEVALEGNGATIIGRWPRFGLMAEGCTAAEVYRDLLSMLKQLLDDPLSAQSLPPLAELLRSSGRRIPREEVHRREDAWLRDNMFAWSVDGRQYEVALFAGATVERHPDTVTVSAFGTSATGADVTDAVIALRRALGTHRPDIDRWVIDEGRPVSTDPDQVARTTQMSAIHAALRNFAPDEIESTSHTRPVLIQFWSDDCGWCLVQAPVLLDVADDLAGRVVVGKVNVGQYPTTEQQFALRSVPTLLLVFQGQELHRIEGHRSARTMLHELSPYLVG